MKFTCEKAILTQAVSLASRTVSPKSSLEALEGICVRAGMGVRLSGYNLENGITVGVSATVSEGGSCIMPAKLFSDIIRKLPDDMVSIVVDDNYRTTISCGISRFSITAMTAEDYPELPDVEGDYSVKMTQADLRKQINGTIFAVSENQARPIHTGCLFEITGDDVTTVAVDGYRMALRRCKTSEENHITLKFVVPSVGLKELEKLLNDTDETVSFTAGKKHISFKVGDAVLICRLLSGEFLDWRRVLPTENPIHMVAKTSAFAQVMDRMSLVISEKVKTPVRCTFQQDGAEFNTASTVGTAHDSCILSGDGGELEIGFNCKYLLDAIRAVPDDEVVLELSNALSPIVLTPCKNDGSFAYMVLPVRLKAE
ncbi:MAG: DNA polymerase III subunit beta [Oscillospiraceae bacterium]|nr:DNA polymerase III subunit beta [Oscillospiraceae bacterium]